MPAASEPWERRLSVESKRRTLDNLTFEDAERMVADYSEMECICALLDDFDIMDSSPHMSECRRIASTIVDREQHQAPVPHKMHFGLHKILSDVKASLALSQGKTELLRRVNIKRALMILDTIFALSEMPDKAKYYKPIVTSTARHLALCGYRDATSGMRSQHSTAGMPELTCVKYLIFRSTLPRVEKYKLRDTLHQTHKNEREGILRRLVADRLKTDTYNKDKCLRMANEILTVKLNRARQEVGKHNFTDEIRKAERHIDTAEAREMVLAIKDHREPNAIST